MITNSSVRQYLVHINLSLTVVSPYVVNLFVWTLALSAYIYQFPVHGENPTLSVVRRFVHLLDQSDVDYSEEVGKEVTFVSLSGTYGSSCFGITIMIHQCVLLDVVRFTTSLRTSMCFTLASFI